MFDLLKKNYLPQFYQFFSQMYFYQNVFQDKLFAFYCEGNTSMCLLPLSKYAKITQVYIFIY